MKSIKKFIYNTVSYIELLVTSLHAWFTPKNSLSENSASIPAEWKLLDGKLDEGIINEKAYESEELSKKNWETNIGKI